MSGPLLDVLDGGLLTTVQDAGRPDWTHLGVPQSGAADPWSLAVANLLAGNPPGAAALEMTIAGPTLRVGGPVAIALAGADLRARIRGGRALAVGRSHRLAAGDIVEVPGDASARAGSGSRCYLAIPGGVDVAVVLGSRSTCLAAAFGGLDGRALRAGDAIESLGGDAAEPGADRFRTTSTVTSESVPVSISDSGIGQGGGPDLVWPEPDAATSGHADRPAVLRVLAGPLPGLDRLTGQTWRVAPAADRVGARLDGADLPAGIGGETMTHAVPWGAIQVPPDGRPIILGPDHQATGGYCVVGVVISADLPILGQLRPGAEVRLAVTDRAAALAALRERRDALVAGAAALREASGWDALVGAAGS